MSLLAAAVTQTSDEEAVAEQIRSPHGAVQHTQQQPLRRNISRRERPERTSTPGAPPEPSRASPDLRAELRDARPMDFLESARMDREMARERRDARSQPSPLSITAALLNTSNQRFAILIAGVALLAVGFLALRSPVFLADFDQWGFQINCGTGFHSELAQAAIAGSTGGQFVDQCQTAVATRRDWAIPLGAAGALLLSGLLATAPRQRALERQTVSYNSPASMASLTSCA
jgi:hypothetical protein